MSVSLDPLTRKEVNDLFGINYDSLDGLVAKGRVKKIDRNQYCFKSILKYQRQVELGITKGRPDIKSFHINENDFETSVTFVCDNLEDIAKVITKAFHYGGTRKQRTKDNIRTKRTSS